MKQDLILSGTGESAFAAFTKIQANFEDLYDSIIPGTGGPGNSYLRLSGGLTRGSGKDIVCYANIEESGGTPGNFVQSPDAVNGDSILIVTPGLYSVSSMVSLAGAGWAAMEIRCSQGGTLDNSNNDANTRTRQGIYGANTVPGSSTQTFKCLAGARIWVWTNSAPDANRYSNQFSIVGPFFSKVFP